jgi:hypothetical protein
MINTLKIRRMASHLLENVRVSSLVELLEENGGMRMSWTKRLRL